MNMIYFDNAATTFPKPQNVTNAICDANKNLGNPGRGGHYISMKSGEKMYSVREKCAEFFGADSENVIFTPGCTHSINYAVKGIAEPGCHFITSNLEHNAVIRPVHSLKAMGCTYGIAKVTDDDDKTVENFEKLITPKTKAIICTLGSNVTGRILPYKKIARLCEERNLCFIADGAQGCGILPVSISDGINVLCVPGHKGLFGPMGIGLMITDGKYKIKEMIQGGTGSASNSVEQPEFLPDRFESGTPNISGIMGIGAGIDFIKAKGLKNIYKHEYELCSLFLRLIKDVHGIVIYRSEQTNDYLPVVPFNIAKLNSEECAQQLSHMKFCLRGGLHCAFLAHKTLGTLESGVVRFAPSIFNTREEVYNLVFALKQIIKMLNINNNCI